MQKRVVVVLGMHRSGTSAMTKGLSTIGVNLGDNLMDSAPQNNEKGFFEDVDINVLNIDLLKKIGHDWHTVIPILPEEFTSSAIADFKLRAVALLRKKLGSTDCFGFKDPRIARLLPFWKEVFAHIGVEDSYIIVFRNPMSVAHSLAKRDSFDPKKAYFLWLEHMLSSLIQTEKLRRVVVNYDHLMEDPEKQIQRVADELGFDFNPKSVEFIEYRTNFLEESLRHTRYQSSDFIFDKSIPSSVTELYKLVSGLAEDSNGFDRQEIAPVLNRLFEKLKENYSVMRYMQKCEDKATVLEKENNELKQHVASLQESVDELNQTFHELNRAAVERDGQIIGLNKAIVDQGEQINRLNQTIFERNTRIDGFNQIVAERDQKIAEQVGLIDDLTRAIVERDQHIHALRTSTSWRLTLPVRWIGYAIRSAKKYGPYLQKTVQRDGGVVNTVLRNRAALKGKGWKGIINRFSTLQQLVNQAEISQTTGFSNSRRDYPEWIRRYDTLTEKARRRMRKRIQLFDKRPIISVVMPTYNPNPYWLVEAIESVRIQVYPNWELCIVDDASTNREVHSIIEAYAQKDPRIKIALRKKNGHISEASNSALQLVSGDYIALLDHDDRLAEHALFWVVEAINSNPDVKLIYSDEDKIDADGNRTDPYFKCEWNDELFHSHNMFSHLGVFETNLVNDVNGFRKGYEGAQDYDLVLRCLDKVDRTTIVHIPRILYHWRAHPDSTAIATEAKPYALLAGRKALQDHLDESNIVGKVEILDFGMYRIRYALPEKPPLVSLIIPLRNGLHLIQQCVESIINKTVYPNYELIIVDNGSDHIDTLNYLKSLDADPRIRVLRDDRQFNFSAINNAAVRVTRGELVGLLNNDIEVISPEWLTEMVSLAVQPKIGAVGARLWYPDDTLQHGGVITGIHRIAGHSHRGLPRGQHGYFGRAALLQNFSAVTAACLIIRKSIYEEVNGLNEIDLKVAFNDVDFCLRVCEAGYRNVWTPFAELYHYESATRGVEDTPLKRARFSSEIDYMNKTWGAKLLNDPAYSPNLTLEHDDFSFAWPPRVELF